MNDTTKHLQTHTCTLWGKKTEIQFIYATTGQITVYTDNFWYNK